MSNPLVEYLRATKSLDNASTEFMWRDADARVTFTAPHAKASFRDGEYKPRDNNVGVIAVEASKLACANAFIPLTPGDADGNWGPGSRFRRALLALVEPGGVVLDIHGMTDQHGPDVVLGTAGGRSPLWLTACLSASLSSAGLTVEVRHTGPLSAGENTLTWTLAELGYHTLQIEVARRCRNGREDPHTMTRLIAALADAGVTASGIHAGLELS
jgi:hypothetical protein